MLNAVPMVGGTLAELLNMVIGSPLERRRGEWERTVAEAINSLRHSDFGFSPEELRDNPIFIDAVLAATAAAVKTSQEAKLDALRNAILNSVLPDAPEIAVQHLFIALIDRLTSWHLMVLKLAHDTAATLESLGRFSTDPLESMQLVYGELQGKGNICTMIWQDLTDARLVGSPTTAGGTVVKWTTDLGDQFFDFIRNPLSPSEQFWIRSDGPA
jgi:hypothetical protein